MIASELIQTQIPVLNLTDTIEVALNYFEEHKMYQIPVIGPNGYVGLLEEDAALGAEKNIELDKLKDLFGIIQTFERYEYKIIATHHKNIHQKGMDDRFESFIKYLNI